MKIRSIRELYYWHVLRPAHKLFLWGIWKLPKSVVYWCVIRAAVKAEPDFNPSEVTATEMLDAMDAR